jgi:hypothetical protein
MSEVCQKAVDYDYDVVGRLIEIAQGTEVYTYTYDDIGR